MKTLPFLKTAFLSLAILSLTSCLKDNDTLNQIPISGLTTINTFTKSESLIHIADNNYIQTPQNPLTYAMSNYANLYPGNRRIRVAIPTNNSALIDTILTFRDSTFYTAFTYGTLEKPLFLNVMDKGLENINNETAVRFFHLAENTAAVHVYLENKETALFENRSLEKGTNGGIDPAQFLPTNPGVRKVIITDTNGNTILEKEHNFSAKKYYSIILMGDPQNTEKPLRIGISEQY